MTVKGCTGTCSSSSSSETVGAFIGTGSILFSKSETCVYSHNKWQRTYAERLIAVRERKNVYSCLDRECLIAREQTTRYNNAEKFSRTASPHNNTLLERISSAARARLRHSEASAKK